MTKQQTTQTAKTSDSTLAAILSAQSDAIEQQLQDIRVALPFSNSSVPPRAPKQGDEESEEALHEAEVITRRSNEERVAFATLQARAKRLQQVQRLLSDDPELLHVVDASIRNRVSAAARRQSVVSIVVAIVSLVAGWLLSAISPLSAAHLLAR